MQTKKRYILVTDGTWGDTLPFMFLAQELMSRGHNALVVSNEYYANYAETQGIPFRSSTQKEDRERLLSNTDLWDSEKGMAVIASYTGVMFEKVCPILEEEIAKGCDLLISHAFSFSAKTMAEKYKIPHHSLLISPIQLYSTYRLPVFYGGRNYNWIPRSIKSLLYPLINRYVLDPLFPQEINKERAEWKLPPIHSFVFWNTEADVTFGLWPEWYSPLEKDQSPTTKKLVGFPLGVEIESEENPALIEWIKNGPKPIVVTLGSGYLHTEKMLKTIKNIAQKHGERFILLGPHNTPDVISKNSSVLCQTHISLSHTLPYCKLAIHHGGAGTLAQVVQAGIPHIVIPQSHDQPDNAYRIESLGLGIALWTQNPTEEELTKAIQTVMSSSYIVKSCIAARERIIASKENGIKKIADLIDEMD